MGVATFECVSCAALVSFGASECRFCELGYRYLDGIAVPELPASVPEPESESFRQPAERSVESPSTALAASAVVAITSSAGLSLFGVALGPMLEVFGASSPAPRWEFVVRVVRSGTELMALGATVVAAAFFLLWIYSANSCLRALGVGSLRFTPKGCVVWWFVPLANLINPYQAVVELWRASHDFPKLDWSSRERSAVLPWWWALWLLCDIVSVPDLPAILEGDYERTALTVLRTLLAFPAALLCSVVVFQIHRNVERACAERRDAPGFEPFRTRGEQ